LPTLSTSRTTTSMPSMTSALLALISGK
jgi:hypothetical protein